MSRPPSNPAAPQSLKWRTIKASSWSLAQVMGLHVLRLASNLIITRLLMPEAFGLMAMVGVLINGFTLFTDIGINRSVAREPDGDQDTFLRVAWMVKIGRGAMIAGGVLFAALMLWIFAPSYAPAGSVYHDPLLPPLVAVSALVPLMLGLESTARELAERNLKMGYQAALEVGAQIVTIIAMVSFALISPSVWALMTGMLTGAALKTLGTHLFFPGPRMRFVWDKDIADRLWHYGKWLLGSSVFTFFAQNADRFILGALLDATVFGIYVIAQIWIMAGALVISRLSDKVGFPVISEMIRTRPDEVARLYRRFQSVIDIFCFVTFLVLLFGGQKLIDVLYPPTYVAAGSYLAILSTRFLAMRFNMLSSLIMNLGNSRAMMVISVVRAVAICVMLPFAYHYYGISAALLVIALNPLVTVPYTLYLVRPVLGARQTAFDIVWLVLTIVVAILVYTYV